MSEKKYQDRNSPKTILIFPFSLRFIIHRSCLTFVNFTLWNWTLRNSWYHPKNINLRFTSIIRLVDSVEIVTRYLIFLFEPRVAHLLCTSLWQLVVCIRHIDSAWSDLSFTLFLVYTCHGRLEYVHNFKRPFRRLAHTQWIPIKFTRPTLPG